MQWSEGGISDDCTIVIGLLRGGTDLGAVPDLNTIPKGITMTSWDARAKHAVAAKAPGGGRKSIDMGEMRQRKPAAVLEAQAAAPSTPGTPTGSITAKAKAKGGNGLFGGIMARIARSGPNAVSSPTLKLGGAARPAPKPDTTGSPRRPAVSGPLLGGTGSPRTNSAVNMAAAGTGAAGYNPTSNNGSLPDIRTRIAAAIVARDRDTVAGASLTSGAAADISRTTPPPGGRVCLELSFRP